MSHEEKNIKTAPPPATASARDAQRVFRALVEPWTKKGLVILPLAAAVADYPQLVDELWPAPLSSPRDAEWRQSEHDGYVIRVPRNLRVNVPLQPPPDTDRTRFGCQLILVEEGAELELLQGCYAAAPAAENAKRDRAVIVLREGAKLIFHTLANSQNRIDDATARSFRLAAGSRLVWRDVEIGAVNLAKEHELSAEAGAALDFKSLATSGATHTEKTLRAASCVFAGRATVHWPFSEGQGESLSLESFLNDIPFEYRVELEQILRRGDV